MNTDNGFQIVMAGEKAIIGKDFHVLEDKSNMVFTSSNPAAFKQYLAENTTIDGDLIITYDEGKIVAQPIKPSYTSEIIACCNLRETPIVSLIRNNLSSVKADAFEKFLYTVRKYYDKAGKELYDQVKHLVIKKVTKIERVSDNSGNYHFCVTRTGDKEDMEPTRTIKFTFPIFDSMSDTVEIEFDVHLEYKEIDGGVAISYSLVNPFFEDEIRQAKLEILESILVDYECLVVYGTAKINRETDAWKYKENGLK